VRLVAVADGKPGTKRSGDAHDAGNGDACRQRALPKRIAEQAESEPKNSGSPVPCSAPARWGFSHQLWPSTP
jgi:hypothetical protein